MGTVVSDATSPEREPAPQPPLPDRPPLPRGATQEQREQRRRMEAMDREQRSDVTQQRKQRVQDSLTEHDRELESVRERVASIDDTARFQAERKKLRSERDALKGQYDALLKEPRTPETAERLASVRRELQAKTDEYFNELQTHERVMRQVRREFLESAALPEAERARFQVQFASGVPRDTQAKAREAQEFLGSLTSNRHGELRVRVAQTADNRDYYSESTVFVRKKSPVHTHVHEMGHAIEDMGGNQAVSRGFLHHRGQYEEAFAFQDRVRHRKYTWREIGIEDDFDKAMPGRGHYAGKFYAPGDGYRDSTEILSMGVEALYNNPAAFARSDPEYFKFVLGALRRIL